MKKLSAIDEQKFWQVIKFLLELKEKTSFAHIEQHLELEKWELNTYLHFLQNLNYKFEVVSEDEKFIIPHQEENQNIKIEFSLLEWLQFQAHFPAISECEGKPFHKEFKKKLVELENEYQDFDLFNSIEVLDGIFQSSALSIVRDGNSSIKEVIAFLEEAVLDKEVVSISMQESKMSIYPHKIIFLDGGLNLIAEDINDKSLVNIYIPQILNISDDEVKYKSAYSQIEVDDFIQSLRSMSENMTRLVLKIYANDQFSLNFNQKYFHNPCLFSNPDGDFIWAATLEPSEEIFKWLAELGSAVEILDPMSFKVEFIKYCEDKLKKLA